MTKILFTSLMLAWSARGQTFDNNISISLTAQAGGPAVFTPLPISGTGNFTVSLSPVNSWLNVSPLAGSGPSTLTITADPTALAAGAVYSGEITVSYLNSSPHIFVTVGVSGTRMTFSPPFGTGMTQTLGFTFMRYDAQGFTVANVLINGALDGRQACYLAFVPSGRNAGSLFLVDNAGNAGEPYAGMALPGSGSIGNEQCTVNGAGSFVSGDGSGLGLSLNVTFTPAFAGPKVVYGAVQYQGMSPSGWQALGTWTVPGASAIGLSAGGVNPARSTGLSQNYTFAFTDHDGWADVSIANVLINDAINGIGACYLAVVPASAESATVFLVDDAGHAGGPFHGMVLPGTDTISNSQCAIAGQGSSITAGGNTLTLTLAISFRPVFADNRIVFAAARNAKQTSGWRPVGTTWVVRGDPFAPYLQGITPSSAPAGALSTTLVADGPQFQRAVACSAACGASCPLPTILVFDHTELPTQPVVFEDLRIQEVTATVPASLLTRARTVDVVVRNYTTIQCVGTESRDSLPTSFAIVP